MAGAPSDAPIAAKELRCADCGAPWTMRGFQTTKTIACEYCGSVFENLGEKWERVQQVHGAYAVKPVYPLGTRGRLDRVEWEVVGWQERSVTAWGTRYPWEEHLLYNPYEGFRYLLFQDGHFCVVEPIPGVPTAGAARARYKDTTYKHFSTADAVVDEVVGEFPWQVRRGDVATASDYVDPPRILSAEESEGELVWSEGRYLERGEVIAAFGKPGRPLPQPGGVHPCQPNPHKAELQWLKKAVAVGFAVWLGFVAFYSMTRQGKVVYKGTVPSKGVMVEGIKLDSFNTRTTLEVEGRAAVDNSWVYLQGMLVNPATEQAHYMGLEISYYHGSGWSEGSRSGSTVVAGIPNGTYALQLSPDAASKYKGPVQVTVKRDVWLLRYPCCTFLLLLVVPVFAFVRSQAFEQARWKESDHPMGG